MDKSTKHKALIEWWLMLPQCQLVIKRNLVTQKCRISINVFYNWLNGRTEIPDIACPIIEIVAGYPMFDTTQFLYEKINKEIRHDQP